MTGAIGANVMNEGVLARILMVAAVAIHRIEAICVKQYNEKHGKGANTLRS